MPAAIGMVTQCRHASSAGERPCPRPPSSQATGLAGRVHVKGRASCAGRWRRSGKVVLEPRKAAGRPPRCTQRKLRPMPARSAPRRLRLRSLRQTARGEYRPAAAMRNRLPNFQVLHPSSTVRRRYLPRSGIGITMVASSPEGLSDRTRVSKQGVAEPVARHLGRDRNEAAAGAPRAAARSPTPPVRSGPPQRAPTRPGARHRARSPRALRRSRAGGRAQSVA